MIKQIKINDNVVGNVDKMIGGEDFIKVWISEKAVRQELRIDENTKIKFMYGDKQYFDR